jgi:hypothetical protein
VDDWVCALREDEVTLHKVINFEPSGRFLGEIVAEVSFGNYALQRIVVCDNGVSEIIRVE